MYIYVYSYVSHVTGAFSRAPVSGTANGEVSEKKYLQSLKRAVDGRKENRLKKSHRFLFRSLTISFFFYCASKKCVFILFSLALFSLIICMSKVIICVPVEIRLSYRFMI